jgi:hypothetical protein
LSARRRALELLDRTGLKDRAKFPPSALSGNALGWGLVDDTPNSFVWEIGHTSPFTSPAGQYCVPGQTFCDSYDAAHWLGFSPLQIKSVTFADGSTASRWAVARSARTPPTAIR